MAASSQVQSTSISPPGFGVRKKVTSDSRAKVASISNSSDLAGSPVSMVLFRPLGPDLPLTEFKQRLGMISSDLHRLLQLETRDFWNVVSLERSVLKSIDSFLRFAPRHWFELDRLPEDEELIELFTSSSRLVFLVLLRLATNKDSSALAKSKEKQTSFMEPSEFGRLIYNKCIWTVPMLLDTVALFGRKNSAILSRMLESMLNCQPKFSDDLGAAFSSTELALRQMTTQLEQLSLIKTHDDRRLLAQISDMVVFSFDAFSTLERLITLHPHSATTLMECCPTLPAYCAEFADSTLLSISNHLLSLSTIVSCQQADCQQLDADTLLQIVAATEVRVVQTFHALLSAMCLRSPDHVNPELYFSTLTTVVGHHRFIWLLDQLFPVASDIAFLEKHHHVDAACRDYVLSALSQARGRLKSTTAPVASPTDAKLDAASGGPAQSDIDDMVQAVCGVMASDMDQAFVAKCLARFDYNADALIQAMLDDNLPPDLRNEQKGSEDKEEEEFDYTSENIQASLASVHIGKRDTELKVEEVQNMKPFYSQFSNVVTKKSTQPPPSPSKPWVNVSVPEMEYEYDDEYDDTYDDNGGAVGPHDDIIRRRAFTVPRILEIGADRVNESSGIDDDEEDEEEAAKAKNSQQSAPQEPPRPVPRPADPRGFKGAARVRQKVASAASRSNDTQPQRKATSSSRGSGNYNRPSRNKNVEVERQEERQEEVEQQNGEPQREAVPVEIQRMQKERHKGRTGNHNRRDLAARKRREF